MSGQPQEWQTDAFRASLVRKLEEAIRDSGNQTEKNAVDLEKQVEFDCTSLTGIFLFLKPVLVF